MPAEYTKAIKITYASRQDFRSQLTFIAAG